MGQKYAAYDTAGAITGFFDDDINPTSQIPADALAITEDEWLDCIHHPGQRMVDVTAKAIMDTPPPPVAQQVADAQAAQVAALYASYAAAVMQPVAYTSAGGVAQTYQADDTSMTYVNRMLAAYDGAKATPAGFYWVAADNAQVPFTYVDLQGLAAAMGAQGWDAFQKLQTRKAQVKAATTVAAVTAVTW